MPSSTTEPPPFRELTNLLRSLFDDKPFRGIGGSSSSSSSSTLSKVSPFRCLGGVTKKPATLGAKSEARRKSTAREGGGAQTPPKPSAAATPKSLGDAPATPTEPTKSKLKEVKLQPPPKPQHSIYDEPELLDVESPAVAPPVQEEMQVAPDVEQAEEQQPLITLHEQKPLPETSTADMLTSLTEETISSGRSTPCAEKCKVAMKRSSALRQSTFAQLPPLPSPPPPEQSETDEELFQSWTLCAAVPIHRATCSSIASTSTASLSTGCSSSRPEDIVSDFADFHFVQSWEVTSENAGSELEDFNIYLQSTS